MEEQKENKKKLTRIVWRVAVVAVIGAGVAAGFCDFSAIGSVLAILGL